MMLEGGEGGASLSDVDARREMSYNGMKWGAGEGGSRNVLNRVN